MDLADCHTAEMTAANVLEEMIEVGGEWLYDRYVEAKVGPTTLEWALGQLGGLVELQFLRRDEGELVVWAGDLQPFPNPADAWARGRVAVKTIIRKAVPALTPVALGTRWSRSTSRSSLPHLQRPSIYPLDWALEPNDPELDTLRMRKEQQTILQKAETERNKAAKALKEETRRRLERATSDLRNNKFTYDYEGNVMLVKPRPLVEVRTVKATVLALPEPQQTKKGYVPRKPVQAAKQTPVSELRFVKSISGGESVMDTLKIGLGVTAFDSLRTKKGPERPWKTMSREDYKLMSTRESGQTDSRSEPIASKSLSLHRRIFSDIPDLHREESGPLPVIDEERLRPAADLSVVDLFNIELLRSQDWGLNIATVGNRGAAQVPEKASAWAIQATHGFKSKHPRDRPFVDRSFPRKCLPPPAAGKTMGHGSIEPCYSPTIKHV